jgi:hypothetical protein
MTMLLNFIANIQDHIFTDINTYEDNEGEMDADTYNEKLETILHEEIDYWVANEYLGEVEQLVCQYGIHKAIRLHIDNFGVEAFDIISENGGTYSRMLLHTIVEDKLDHSYEEYKKWVENNRAESDSDSDDE